MSEQVSLAHRFEEHRARLRAVAFRMLGSAAEAEDAVQETWLRLDRSDGEAIQNLGGWLTTVVSRVCLDALRSRKTRREDSIDVQDLERIETPASGGHPEHDVLRDEAVGLALLLVLDALPPAERVAFVLHDLFALSFADIAPILDRSLVATRQLASRARRRVHEAAALPDADRSRQEEVVGAFRAAARTGDLNALLVLLAPDVVLRADAAAIAMGAPGETRGAEDVAATFLNRARAAEPVLVDETIGLAWRRDGRAAVVFDLTLVGGRIAAIDLVADPAHIAAMTLAPLEP